MTLLEDAIAGRPPQVVEDVDIEDGQYIDGERVGDVPTMVVDGETVVVRDGRITIPADDQTRASKGAPVREPAPDVTGVPDGVQLAIPDASDTE